MRVPVVVSVGFHLVVAIGLAVSSLAEPFHPTPTDAIAIAATFVEAPGTADHLPAAAGGRPEGAREPEFTVVAAPTKPPHPQDQATTTPSPPLNAAGVDRPEPAEPVLPPTSDSGGEVPERADTDPDTSASAPVPPALEPEPLAIPAELALDPDRIAAAPPAKPNVSAAAPTPEALLETPPPPPVVPPTAPRSVPVAAEADAPMATANAAETDTADIVPSSAPTGTQTAALGNTANDQGSGTSDNGEEIDAGSPDGSTRDSAAAADYAQLLGAWLDRYKEYPDRARKRNQEGVVMCEFTLAADGAVLSHRILESSGFPMLDQEADALFRRASPLPAPPPGAEQTFRVPIVFALN